jgi:hypothetical protein
MVEVVHVLGAALGRAEAAGRGEGLALLDREGDTEGEAPREGEREGVALALAGGQARRRTLWYDQSEK